MKYTYYFNGIKLRKSERDYTHAVVMISENADGTPRITCLACCGSLRLAEKRFEQERNDNLKAIVNYERIVSEMKDRNYKDWGYDKNGRWCRCVELPEEWFNVNLPRYVEYLEWLRTRYHLITIVELDKC